MRRHALGDTPLVKACNDYFACLDKRNFKPAVRNDDITFVRLKRIRLLAQTAQEKLMLSFLWKARLFTFIYYIAKCGSGSGKLSRILIFAVEQAVFENRAENFAKAMLAERRENKFKNLSQPPCRLRAYLVDLFRQKFRLRVIKLNKRLCKFISRNVKTRAKPSARVSPADECRKNGVRARMNERNYLRDEMTERRLDKRCARRIMHLKTADLKSAFYFSKRICIGDAKRRKLFIGRYA